MAQRTTFSKHYCRVFFTCGECGLDIHSFYALRKHKLSLHKIQKQSSESDYIEIDFDTILGDHELGQIGTN